MASAAGVFLRTMTQESATTGLAYNILLNPSCLRTGFNSFQAKRQQLFIGVGAENLKEYNKITNRNLKRQYLFIDELGEAMEIFEIELL